MILTNLGVLKLIRFDLMAVIAFDNDNKNSIRYQGKSAIVIKQQFYKIRSSMIRIKKSTIVLVILQHIELNVLKI